MILTAIIICLAIALVAVVIISASKRKENKEFVPNNNSTITYSRPNNTVVSGLIPVSQMEKDTEFEVYWNGTKAIAVVDFKNESGHSVVNIVDKDGDDIERAIDDMSDEMWDSIRVKNV